MTLPVCPARREIPHEPDVFQCAHPQVFARGQRVHAGVCSICTYWREFTDASPATAKTLVVDAERSRLARSAQCLFLGEQIGESACPTCPPGKVRIKVFRCTHPHHSQTTIPDCQTCRDYLRPARET